MGLVRSLRDAREQSAHGFHREPRAQRPASREEIPLDPFDVRPVRDDEDRLAPEHSQISLQKKRDFARVGRPGDEAEPHRSILDLGPDGS